MHVNTLLFDLGGVLIELGSLEPLVSTSSQRPDEIRQNWLHSPSVRLFESGQCSDEEFAHSMISELSLDIGVVEFLETFNAWPVGVYDGAEQMLNKLSGSFGIACLSNTNAAHYDSFLSRQAILLQFERLFLSHKTGLLKPDTAAFEHVSEELGLEPSEILFFDDNPDNVQAASRAGMQAALANTPDGVINQLREFGVHI